MTPSNRRGFLRQTVGALAGVALLPDRLEALPTFQEGPHLTVGVVGLGRQGRAILTELQKITRVQVVAVCDSLAPRLEAQAARYKGVTAFADHRALLDHKPEVQAIIVATPTHLHRQIVEDALAAGRHVYCEAPIASTVEDCQALARAAAAAKGSSQAGFQGRTNPLYRRAQPLVTAELRRMVAMYAQSHRKTSWRVPAGEGQADSDANWRLNPDVSLGLAGEVAAQQVDVANWFRGAYPVSVGGRGAVRLHNDGRTTPDTIELEFTWPDEVRLTYRATLANSYGGEHEIFYGTTATLRLAGREGYLFKEQDAPTQGWEVYAPREEFFGDEGIVLVAEATQLASQADLRNDAGLPHPPLYYALVGFLRAAWEGQPVACSMEEGARATIVGILANQAVLTGKPVEIPKFGA